MRMGKMWRKLCHETVYGELGKIVFITLYSIALAWHNILMWQNNHLSKVMIYIKKFGMTFYIKKKKNPLKSPNVINEYNKPTWQSHDRDRGGTPHSRLKKKKKNQMQ